MLLYRITPGPTTAPLGCRKTLLKGGFSASSTASHFPPHTSDGCAAYASPFFLGGGGGRHSLEETGRIGNFSTDGDRRSNTVEPWKIFFCKDVKPS